MLLLCPEWIAPVAPAPTVLTRHAVAIDADRIVGLMPLEQAMSAWPDAERIERPGHLLIPGLVNLHTHAAMALLRGVGDDMALGPWLRERIWPLEARLMSPEFVFDGTLLACAEMLLGGTTCFNDMYFFPDQVAAAAAGFGMRVALGIIVIDFPSAWGSDPDAYLSKGMALRERWRDNPLTSFCLAPHAPYTVGDAALRRIADLAASTGMPVHCHIHETADEVTEGLAQTGQRPLHRLANLGLVGPGLIAVHAVHLDDSDLRLLADSGASVAHCPHSNLKLASGVAPTTRMRDLGIPVGIGTDGSASNNRLDMLLEGRSAALLAKGASRDATVWNAHQTLRAMTLDGARALALDRLIGSIEAGKQADLVTVDLRGASGAPVFDPVSELIYAAGRDQVADVWIAGRSVVRKRQLVDSTAIFGLDQVVSRGRVWHNRIAEILSASSRVES